MMTPIETVGMFYTILAVGCFTSVWLVSLAAVAFIGAKTLWRWIRTGQQKDEAERDYAAFAAKLKSNE